jgi:creatinine amidohydrolase
MRPYILGETNWTALKDEKFELAILPWGATEAHNFHMPYATDVIEADHIAAESARKAWDQGAKVVVLPTIPFGVNTGQSDIYLDINMNPSTQMAILGDVIEVLNRQNIKKFMVLNSHGGNDFKTMLRELGLKYPDMFLCMTNWFKLPDKMKYFENAGDHADEMETSLILYLRPELVLPSEEWGNGSEKKNKIRGFREGWAWSERPWSKITADTGVGDPSEASAEKGKRFFEYVTTEMAELIVHICREDPDKLYE